MRKLIKFLFGFAIALVLLGIGAFVGALALNDWDIKKLSTSKFETNTYDVTENFNSISVDLDTSDIEFILSSDSSCKVVSYESEKVRHTISVENDVLLINSKDDRKWYDYIGFSFSSPKMTLYLPECEYDSLNLKNSTGDIKIPNSFNFNDVKISNSTGNVDFSANVTNDLKIKVSTGDIKLYNVIVLGTMNLDSSTGDIKLNSCDAKELYLVTSTGDIDGTLLSDKIFDADTSTGDVRVPNTTTGGICRIRTSTGDITFEIKA